MRDLAKKVLLHSSLPRLLARLRSRGAAILMYHSVMENPHSQDVFLGGISHSRDVFRRQMELLRRKYHPVSLDQVRRFVCGDGDLPERATVVTFDDGYADNYEIAAPILNDLGIPAIFYVTVECVEEGRLPWPALLRFTFRTTKQEKWIDSSGKRWPLSSETEREEALLVSCDECGKLAGATQSTYILRLERELDKPVPVESGALMMNYDHIRALAQQGHLVGSHTMTHPNMAYIDFREAHYEMAQSKQRLEEQLNTTITHFSYPCPALAPHWTEQTVIASRDAGYETSVTTDGGLARKGDNPLSLARVRPTKTVEGLWWNLECAFAGRSV